MCTARNQYKGEMSAAGPAISDMVFSSIVVRDSQFGITANVLAGTKPPAGIRDLLFTGMKVRSRRGNYLAGHKDVPIRGIAFRDVDFTVTGQLDKAPETIPDAIDLWGTRTVLPHAFYVRHAEDIAFRDCRIRWDGAAGGWASAFHAADGREIDCRNLRADPFRDGVEPITSERVEIRRPASDPGK